MQASLTPVKNAGGSGEVWQHTRQQQHPHISNARHLLQYVADAHAGCIKSWLMSSSFCCSSQHVRPGLTPALCQQHTAQISQQGFMSKAAVTQALCQRLVSHCNSQQRKQGCALKPVYSWICRMRSSPAPPAQHQQSQSCSSNNSSSSLTPYWCLGTG